MLAKKYRLPGYLIPTVLKTGKIFNLELFMVKFLPSKTAQFTFVVSPKISKKAVIRNRIKRRLAEALRKNLTDFRPKMQIIFLAKKEILTADFAEMENQVKQAIDQLNQP